MNKAIRNNVVECLDDGAPYYVRGPLALNHTFVYLGNVTVAKRIVISGVDDRRCHWQACEQIIGERRHVLHWNGDDQQINSIRDLGDIDGSSTSFLSDLDERTRTARVCDHYRVR